MRCRTLAGAAQHPAAKRGSTVGVRDLLRQAVAAELARVERRIVAMWGKPTPPGRLLASLPDNPAELQRQIEEYVPVPGMPETSRADRGCSPFLADPRGNR
jgi:hypothetical protein